MRVITIPEIQDRLGPRGANVLGRLRVSSIEDFLKLTEDEVLRLKNVGQITWDKIKAIQDELRRISDSAGNVSTEASTEPIDIQSRLWEFLEYGEAPDKVRRIVQECDIQFVGQFLLLTRDYVISLPGIGETTWSKILLEQEQLKDKMIDQTQASEIELDIGCLKAITINTATPVQYTSISYRLVLCLA